ncbi:hypothetical protein GCK72_020778 [Caenorhabditis remanei]|uniref:Uncharacterized protein n=1 Tax=Caenorhabditis remanei TaxID=31234 RepID=A0A6A5GG75_CAERE|nr:hypothetical protein GCK72_020778 [Caenorhabditis remanei]KAF1754218.1 hypothetical protein GCK72_020778 [Caenorhabditis remanei]
MASKAPPLPSSPPPPYTPRRERYLETSIRKCIPKELIPETWKFMTYPSDKPEFTLNIESLFSQGQPQLGMFESAKELGDTVAQYMEFPKNKEHFKKSRTTRIERFPEFPKSLTGKWCMYTNDLYKVFDYHKYSTLRVDTNGLAEVVLEDMWDELRIEKHHTMFVCPHEPLPPTFDNAHRGILLADLMAKGSTVPLNAKIDWMWLAKTGENDMTTAILESMGKHVANFPYVDNKEAQKIVSWVGYVLGEATVFIQKLGIHLPPATSLAPPDDKPTPVIRLFSSDSKSFVFAQDFQDILFEYNTLSPEYIKSISKLIGMKTMSTLSYEEVMEMVEKVGNPDLKKLEFAKMKNDLLMFTQTPIPTYHSRFCSLAADALYELLMDIIVAKKVFHTFQEKDWNKINEFFESIKSHFDIDRDIYFIDFEEVENIKKKWEKFYIDHLKRDSKLIQLKKDKFDVNGLIRTLKFLKLDKCFGDIVEYAHPIFTEMENLKLNGKIWTSPHYLYVAIAQCQMNCLARKVPWILEFFEKQNSCNRMNIMNISTGQGDIDLDKLVAELEQMGTSDKKQGAKGNVANKKNKNNKKK